MITYLSLRGSSGGTRVTAYLAPQAYALAPVREGACARVGDIRRAVELAQARYAAQAGDLADVVAGATVLHGSEEWLAQCGGASSCRAT